MDSTNSTNAGTDTNGARIAEALADMFNTGVNAYVDSQLSPRYDVQDPRYYNNGYPGGVPSTVNSLARITSSPGGMLLVVGIIVVTIVLLRK